jgi:hypothetical protein
VIPRKFFSEESHLYPYAGKAGSFASKSGSFARNRSSVSNPRIVQFQTRSVVGNASLASAMWELKPGKLKDKIADLAER